MQKVVGSNPISRLPRLIRPNAGKDARRGVFSGEHSRASLSACDALSRPFSSSPSRWLAAAGLHRVHDAGRHQADFISLGDAICRNHESQTRDLETQTIELGRIDSTEKAHRVAGLLRQQADNLAAEA